MMVRIKPPANRIGLKVGIGRPVVEIGRSMIGTSRLKIVMSRFMIGIDLMNRIGRLIVGKLRPIVVEKISRPVRRINWARKGVDHHIVGKDRPKVGNSRQMLNVNPLERNISPVEVGNNLRLMKIRSPRRNINVKICHQVVGM
jgi:hypothetical protein